MTQAGTTNANTSRESTIKLEPMTQSHTRELGNAAVEKITEYSDAAMDKYKHIRKNVEETANEVSDRTKDLLAKVDTVVKEHPMRSALVMLGAGVLLGMITKSLLSSRK